MGVFALRAPQRSPRLNPTLSRRRKAPRGRKSPAAAAALAELEEVEEEEAEEESEEASGSAEAGSTGEEEEETGEEEEEEAAAPAKKGRGAGRRCGGRLARFWLNHVHAAAYWSCMGWCPCCPRMPARVPARPASHKLCVHSACQPASRPTLAGATAAAKGKRVPRKGPAPAAAKGKAAAAGKRKRAAAAKGAEPAAKKKKPTAAQQEAAVEAEAAAISEQDCLPYR